MTSRIPLENADAIREAAKLARLPLAAACALIEKESGGRNIYGHDAGGAGPAGQPVTKANFEKFLARVLAGATSNGVGPAQITWAGSLVNGRRDGGFFTAMQARGLDPWVPVDNMRFGFELLAGYHAETGSWVEAGTRYNGARTYGQDLAARVRVWRLRLEEAQPDTLDVFAWNPHTAHDSDHFAQVLTDQLKPARPDVIVLNEVRRQYRTLAKWAKVNGYTVFQEEPVKQVGNVVPEHGTTALLVTAERPDLSVKRHRVVAMKLRWTVFSHNQPHAPRRFHRVRLTTAGGSWKVTASHWPTNGFEGGNRASFLEAATRAALSLVANPRTPAADIGDHNESVGVLRKWGKPKGFKVDGSGPDSAIVRGCTAEAAQLPKWRSDHHAHRITLTRP